MGAMLPVPTLAMLGLLGGMAVPALAQHRIVTLSPSLTEAVCALGHCGELVGTDRHSTGPGPVAALPKLGGLADAQIESIVALRPDLVLLGPRSRAGERLAALGLQVQVFDARTHADLRRMLIDLGRALGEPERAAALLRRIDGELDTAARRVPEGLRGRSVYVEVERAFSAASSKSFIGETVARLGLVNVVDGEIGLFPRVSPELVVRSAPDVIIGPAVTLAEMARRPGWGQLPAVREGRVCLLDPARMDLLARPGPRVGEAAVMLAECLRGLPPLRGR